MQWSPHSSSEFLIFQVETPHHWTAAPRLLPPAQAASIPLSVIVPHLSPATVACHLFLTSLSSLISGVTHVVSSIRISSLFLLSKEFYIVYFCHILFLCPPGSGHLAFIYFLTILNQGTVDTGVKTSVHTPGFSPLGVIQGAVLFHFMGSCVLASAAAALFYIPSRMHKVRISPHLYFLLLF